MSDRPQLDWLRVRTSLGLDRILRHVKGDHQINTYSGPRQDRKGDWIILLGWDDRPDSDWGRFKGNSAAIWFADEGLAIEGEKRVRSALGWPADAEQSA